MRLGVLLPTFRRAPDDALAAARAAAEAGLDGVFAYDHVWPMGSPSRPAIAPFEVLAAVATEVPSLVVGPLVARVGLVDDAILLGQCRALATLAPGRTVAALGTGDALSREENEAYGVPVAPPEDRRASLRAIATALREDGVEVWVGTGAAATVAVARAVGATLNLWDLSPPAVAAAAADGPVSWAGPAPGDDRGIDEAATRALAAELEAAGATWAVFSPQVPVGLVAALR
jgi:Luciferase-like monooxygenase